MVGPAVPTMVVGTVVPTVIVRTGVPKRVVGTASHKIFLFPQSLLEQVFPQ